MLTSCENSDVNMMDGGEIEEVARVAQVSNALTATGGIRILSDSNSAYGLNAYGGATDGGSVQLWRDCPKSNPDCLWTFRNGMIVSATNSALAVKGGGTDLSPLTLSAACTPNNADCVWTWSMGMLINKATRFPLHWSASVSSPSAIELKNGCTASDPACTWTLENAPISSVADPRLGVYVSGGTNQNPPGKLVQGTCSQTDPACTWTFRQGMIYSDADPGYQINAYGGAAPGTELRAYPGCWKENPDCTWTISGGQILSDNKATGTLAVSATGGPFSNSVLKLSTTGGNTKAMVECHNADATHPACLPGYGCFANDTKQPAGGTVDDECRAECPIIDKADDPSSNPNCMFDAAPGSPTTWSGSPSPKAAWTVMVVFLMDGDFSTDALAKIGQLSRAGSTDQVNIIAMVGTPNWYNWDEPKVQDASGRTNYAVHVPLYQGEATYVRINRNAPPTSLQSVGNVDMTKPTVLSAFGNFAITNFPADHYALVQLDHGSGWSGYGQDASATVDPKSISIPNGDYATILSSMTLAAGKKIDIVAFDACLMATWEVSAASAPYADYLVGSERTEGGSPWSYVNVMRQLIAQPTMSSESLSRAMVTEYEVASSPTSNTLSDTSLAAIPALTTALSDLGSALQNPTLYNCIENNGRKLAYGVPDTGSERRDLYDLADKLDTNCNITAARAVKTALTNAVLQINTPGNTHPAGYPFGLSIYMPARCSNMDRLYYGGNGESWSNNGIGDVWSQQTQWDEFLRGFAPAGTESTPPTPVLTAASGTNGTSAVLSWTLPTTAYGLTYTIRRGTAPGTYDTTLATGLTSLSYTDSGLNSGVRYFYAVSAADCKDGANSNEVSVGPPVVSITSPANNAVFTAPASISVSSSAADAGGSISKVDFYSGTTLVKSDTTFPYSCTLTNVGGGSYTLTAKAYDNNGLVTTSSPVNVTVNEPCSSLCSPWVVKTGPGIQSGNLGTGTICHQTTSNLTGGNCSNMTGRTLKVNGTTMNCNGWTLPAKRNGGYCIQVTSGGLSYASYATW
jgi:hypothetical protein